jgi:hypothetical protein
MNQICWTAEIFECVAKFIECNSEIAEIISSIAFDNVQKTFSEMKEKNEKGDKLKDDDIKVYLACL